MLQCHRHLPKLFEFIFSTQHGSKNVPNDPFIPLCCWILKVIIQWVAVWRTGRPLILANEMSPKCLRQIMLGNDGCMGWGSRMHKIVFILEVKPYASREELLFIAWIGLDGTTREQWLLHSNSKTLHFDHLNKAILGPLLNTTGITLNDIVWP